MQPGLFGGRWNQRGHPLGRQRGQHHMLLMLLFQVMQLGVDNIPPVTLAVLALCVANFLGLTPIGQPPALACFSVVEMLFKPTPSSWSRFVPASAWHVLGFLNLQPAMSLGNLCRLEHWARLFVLSPLNHLDDYHLYYNLTAWLYRARLYERAKGTAVMLLFCLAALLGVGIVYVCLSWCIIVFTDPDWFGPTLEVWLSPNGCVVGLSGVLFALKTVVHGMDDPHAPAVFNGLMHTEAQYLVWLELIWIQMVLPQRVSFLGHLSGILFGLAYVKWNAEQRWIRPAARRLERFVAELRPQAPPPAGQRP